MALLEDIVDRIAFIQKEIVDKDQRIRWLENALAKMMAGGGFGTKESNEKSSEETTISDDVDGWIVGPRIHSIICENDVGHLFDNPAPMDHKHQGVFGLSITQCNGIGFGFAHVGMPFFKTLATDSIGLKYVAGESVDDEKGQTPTKGGVVNPNWLPTYCDSEITISHLYNSWVATDIVGVEAETPCDNLGCTFPMAKFPIDVPDHDVTCNPLWLPIKLHVDCNGHLTEAKVYEFKRMTLSERTPASPDNVIPCDTNVDVFAPYVKTIPDPLFPPTGIDCLEDVKDVSGQWRLVLYKKTLCIPCDAWNPETPPESGVSAAGQGGCSTGEAMVVTGITVTDKSLKDCGHDITVTYGCVPTTGGGGCPDGISRQVTFVREISCTSDTLNVIQDCMTFTNGCLTALTCGYACRSPSCPGV